MTRDERGRARAERLAAALRENLRRRKQGMRADAVPPLPIPSADPPD